MLCGCSAGPRPVAAVGGLVSMQTRRMQPPRGALQQRLANALRIPTPPCPSTPFPSPQAAERDYDLTRAAELKYGTLLELQKQLKDAESLLEQAEKVGAAAGCWGAAWVLGAGGCREAGECWSAAAASPAALWALGASAACCRPASQLQPPPAPAPTALIFPSAEQPHAAQRSD